MKLEIRQKVFALLDTFKVYDMKGNVCYTVESVLDLSHHFIIYDMNGRAVGELEEVYISLLHTFSMRKNGREFGKIVKQFSIFRPKFTIEAMDYTVEGDCFHWDYTVKKGGRVVGTVATELMTWGDTYTIDVDSNCVLEVLMIALAIDAVKCDHGL